MDDVSTLGHVHNLNLLYVYKLNRSFCHNITDFSPLSKVHTLNLSHSKGVFNVNSLGDILIVYFMKILMVVCWAALLYLCLLSVFFNFLYLCLFGWSAFFMCSDYSFFNPHVILSKHHHHYQVRYITWI
jgi:hypothetical protein